MRSVYWKETPNETCMYWKETHKVRTSIFWWWSMNCDVKREACLSCQTWGKKKRRVCIEKEADKRDLTFQECGSLVLVSFWCCFDVRRVYHVRREACLLKRDPKTSLSSHHQHQKERCVYRKETQKNIWYSIHNITKRPGLTAWLFARETPVFVLVNFTSLKIAQYSIGNVKRDLEMRPTYMTLLT